MNLFSRQIDLGLIILRFGIGGMYLYHGYPKITGGPDKWEKIGTAMQYVGIDWMPVFWGFMAAVSEFCGGILLILGIFFTPACLLMLTTMAVAASMHIGKGEGLLAASHAIENGIVFLSLLFIGPGKYRFNLR